MAKIHILEQAHDGRYHTVLHFATPPGGNTHGVTWKAAALEAGLIGVTSLSVGPGPGQITEAERDSVVAGDTVELRISELKVGDGGVTPEALNTIVDKHVVDWKLRVQRRLEHYGYTQG